MLLRTWTPRLTLAVGGAFVVTGAVGFLLSVRYGLVSGLDNALGPPWVMTVVFAGSLWVVRRRDRWGLVGAVVMLLAAASYLAAGQLSEPITSWAYGHNLGFAIYITAALVCAVLVVVASGLELWVRARNSGRIHV
jgi:hypothetical protein